MSIDSKLRRKVEAAVGESNLVGKKNQDYYVPSAKYPHIHFYDGGCELRHGNGGGQKLYNKNKLYDENIAEAIAEGGSIKLAAEVIQKYY